MNRVLITGSTGLIGRHLSGVLRARGDQVVGLSRSGSGRHVRRWDPTAASLDPALVSGFDVVVHLAGENIGEGRWTETKKRRIRDSRVHATRMLSEALARAEGPPALLISGSAVGYYGNRGAEVLSEDSGPGRGFLAEVTTGWERAAEPAQDAGITVVHPRTGPVLSTLGGALAKMLPPFKMGLGGVVGSGTQYMSWITLDDTVAALCHLVDHALALQGPVNLVAPNPVTNREFTHVLGHVLKRPTAIPLPAMAARLALGEMADELLLGGQRVSPERLEASGFRFQFPQLEGALQHVIETHG